MRQTAPDPEPLHSLIRRLTYKPGWAFYLTDLDRGQGSAGLTLVINITGPDTNDVEHTIRVSHFMIVPAASYTEPSWRRWLLDQILLVEAHEACEFFRVDGEQPYAPNHGEGEDPYRILELTTAGERAKTFRD